MDAIHEGGVVPHFRRQRAEAVDDLGGQRFDFGVVFDVG